MIWKNIGRGAPAPASERKERNRENAGASAHGVCWVLNAKLNGGGINIPAVRTSKILY